MKKVDNIIFLSNTVKMNVGGPCGYLANLQIGLKDIKTKDVVLLHYDKSNKYHKICKKLCKLLTFWIINTDKRHSLQNKLKRFFSIEDKDRYNHEESLYRCMVKKLNKYDFKTITCHTCRDVLNIRKYLDAKGLSGKVKLLQMEHSPSFESIEIYNLLHDSGDSRANDIAKEWRKFEKSAFLASDIILAPAPEALDSYRKDAKWFDEMLKHKPVKYVPTGCVPLHSDYSSQEIRKKYNIKTKNVICYIGRHLPVRGYETLKRVGMKLLKKRDDVTFLIAGKQEVAYPAPIHERWIEAGYSKTADILKASDLMILANKTAYFDLILLETMSMGTPVIVSNVNGNKAVHRQTKGAIEIFETDQELMKKIIKILDMSEQSKKKMSKNILNEYACNYTTTIFAKNYVKMIKEVINGTHK